jgi:hypothetical protein
MLFRLGRAARSSVAINRTFGLNRPKFRIGRATRRQFGRQTESRTARWAQRPARRWLDISCETARRMCLEVRGTPAVDIAAAVFKSLLDRATAKHPEMTVRPRPPRRVDFDYAAAGEPRNASASRRVLPKYISSQIAWPSKRSALASPSSLSIVTLPAKRW